VRTCLDLMQKELDVTMGFCGCTTIGQIDRQVLLG